MGPAGCVGRGRLRKRSWGSGAQSSSPDRPSVPDRVGDMVSVAGCVAAAPGASPLPEKGVGPLQDATVGSHVRLPEHSVLTLPRLYHGHLDEIIEEGRWTLEELQGHSRLKPKHENYIQAARTGEPYIDTSEARGALSELEYPLYVLDFEAIDYALPPFEGTSPWKKIPFQYSLHVVKEGHPGGPSGGISSVGSPIRELRPSPVGPRKDLSGGPLRPSVSEGELVVEDGAFRPSTRT